MQVNTHGFLGSDWRGEILSEVLNCDGNEIDYLLISSVHLLNTLWRIPKLQERLETFRGDPTLRNFKCIIENLQYASPAGAPLETRLIDGKHFWCFGQ